jgi:hypothetical protein
MSLCAKTSKGPFDPDNGLWTPVPLSNGVPLFSEQTLKPLSQIVMDKNGKAVGEASLNCQYAGSYW